MGREEGRQEAGIAWAKESDTTVSVRGQPDPDQWGDTDSRSVQTAREWTVTGVGLGTQSGAEFEGLCRPS